MLYNSASITTTVYYTAYLWWWPCVPRSRGGWTGPPVWTPPLPCPPGRAGPVRFGCWRMFWWGCQSSVCTAIRHSAGSAALGSCPETFSWGPGPGRGRTAWRDPKPCPGPRIVLGSGFSRLLWTCPRCI